MSGHVEGCSTVDIVYIRFLYLNMTSLMFYRIGDEDEC
jgi:hypothetical protein